MTMQREGDTLTLVSFRLPTGMFGQDGGCCHIVYALQGVGETVSPAWMWPYRDVVTMASALRQRRSR